LDGSGQEEQPNNSEPYNKTESRQLLPFCQALIECGYITLHDIRLDLITLNFLTIRGAICGALSS